MSTNQSWKNRSENVFMPTYARFPATIIEGKGCKLKDADGKEYLDFLAGIAVCNLGHCHTAVTEAICVQAGRLTHVSNLFHTIPQTELAELLVQHSFADQVFFANSGAEANEAAIKLARKYSAPGKYEIISLESSFHGRTLATIAATGQPKFHAGFEPMPDGFVHAPFGDAEAIEKRVTPQTCAILCEPLQGEGGVRPLSPEYLKEIKAICDKHDLLLIFDEVQMGMGRTGSLFAYEQLGVTPDIMTLAKALANGLPIGAMLTSKEIGAHFVPGTHASTFGGNPVVCAAGIATLNTILADGFLESVCTKGEYLVKRLQEIADAHPKIATGVRGKGLIQGLVLTAEGCEQGPAIVNALFEEGILINFAGGAVLRCIPPLVVSEQEIDEMIAGLNKVLSEKIKA